MAFAELTTEDPHAANSPSSLEAAVRVAIISTPRSGNVWLRHLLGHVYGARELAVHNPDDLDWISLPSDCVLQIHWRRTAPFEALLERHGFRVVVLARHPLDVLLSILHFALHDGSTQRWLEGEEGTEAPICGAMPTSTAFAKYGTGRRAALLLSVSRQWWDWPQACTVHYEHLVADPLGQLTRVVEALGAPVQQPLAEAVASHTLSKLRLHGGNDKIPESGHHFWQGNPGHWKRLLPADVAFLFAATHAEVFRGLGYNCDPDPTLDRAQADSNWIELNRQELTSRLWSHAAIKQGLDQALARQGALEQQCAELKACLEQRIEQLAAADRLRADLEAELAVADRRRTDLEAELASAKQAIQNLSRAPLQRVASLIKRLLGV